jgi:hypothetical protein
MPYFKNENINLLIIHIPKTGGTSLEVYFHNKYKIPLNNDSLYNFLNNKKKINIDSSLQHMTYQTIFNNKDFFKIDTNNITILSIVRNPYERIISDLFHISKHSLDIKIHINSTKEEVYHEIQKYLKLNNTDNHNLPQYLFVTDENKQLIPNIKLLHTETLQEDMIKLGYTDFNLTSNKNPIQKDENYYDYLNEDSIRLINDFYDYDFQLFHYDKITV